MPLDSGTVIPDGWSTHHRPTAEAAMTAECELRRPGHSSGFNETTGRTMYLDPVVLWSGPLRVQVLARAGSGAFVVGDRQVTNRPYQVSLPTDSIEARVNDQVAVTACADDPQLVGRVLRVVDVPTGSLLWQRDLICEDTTPTTR